jgi:hypothetical protein
MSHLYIFSCFCMCALIIHLRVSYFAKGKAGCFGGDGTQIRLVISTNLNAEFLSKIMTSPFRNPPFVHSLPWGQRCWPLPRANNGFEASYVVACLDPSEPGDPLLSSLSATPLSGSDTNCSPIGEVRSNCQRGSEPVGRNAGAMVGKFGKRSEPEFESFRCCPIGSSGAPAHNLETSSAVLSKRSTRDLITASVQSMTMIYRL